MTTRRNPLADFIDQATGQPKSSVGMIPSAEKKPRMRTWEKNNRAWSYIIPRPLHEVARQIRVDILALSQYDETGQERMDRTTVDGVASALMDYALAKVDQSPTLLRLHSNPHSRGQMTVSWEAWDTWDKSRLDIPKPKAKSTKKISSLYLAYRWASEEIDTRVRELAGEGTPSASNKNPLKHAVPAGEVVVRLLQIALDGYRNREFKLLVEPHALGQHVTGWETWRSK
jgi:hypothetical protein